MGKVDGVTAFKQGLTVKKQVKKRSSSSLQEWGAEEVREGGCLKGCSRKALYEIRPEHLEETKWLPLPPRIPLCFFLSLVGLLRSRHGCTDPKAEEKLGKLEHGDWERRRKEPGGEGTDHIKWELASPGSMVQISIPSKAHVWRTKPQLVTLLGVAKPLCLLWWPTQSTVSGPAWGGWGVALLKWVCQWGRTLRLKAPTFFQFPLSASYLWWRIWALSFLLWLSRAPNTSFPCPDRLYPLWKWQPKSTLHSIICLALARTLYHSRHAQEWKLCYWRHALDGDIGILALSCSHFYFLAIKRSHHVYSFATGPGAMNVFTYYGLKLPRQAFKLTFLR